MKGIFQTCLVDVRVVNANPPFLIRLLHPHYVGYPFQKFSFSDESAGSELLYFFIDCEVSFGVEHPSFLDFIGLPRKDVEAMGDDIQIDSRHISMHPSEYVFVLAEESLETNLES